MKIEHIVQASGLNDIDLRISPDDASRKIVAKAGNDDRSPTIEIEAYTGNPIRQWWSEHPIVMDLAGMQEIADPSRMVFLRDHDPSRPMGHASEVGVKNNELFAKGVLSVDNADTREFTKSSKEGFPWRASIGATDLEAAYIPEGKKLQCNGRTYEGPVIHIAHWKLKEISVVTLGADDSTNSVAASTEQKQKRDEIMKHLKRLKTNIKASDSDPNEGSKNVQDPKVVKGSQVPEPTPAPTPTPTADPVEAQLEKERKIIAAEQRRLADLEKACEGHRDILAKAIEENWTVEKAELEVLRSSRPTVNRTIPAVGDMTAEVLAAAVCQTTGLPEMEKSFTEQTLDAADKTFKGAIGLNQLLHIIASQAGYTGDHYFRNATSLREAIRAAFSSRTLSSVLSNVANKFILQGFYSEERIWEKIAKINSSVQNFKEYETYSRISELKLQRLAPDGRIKHGTIGDEKYGNQIDTFAIMLGLPRKAFIDDDIGILASLALEFGIGAAETLNDVFWTEFQDDASFFTLDNGNLMTGPDSAMAEKSLKAGFTKFRSYKKATGKGKETRPIGMPAKYILTGVALEWVVNEWMKGTDKRTGKAETITTRNLLAGQAEPLSTRYLSSETAWYLLADPIRRPTMEVGFLRGKTRPTIEEVEPDADMLGIAMRAYWDFGCRKQVPEGGLKSEGA